MGRHEYLQQVGFERSLEFREKGVRLRRCGHRPAEEAMGASTTRDGPGAASTKSCACTGRMVEMNRPLCVALGLLAATACMPPSWGANAILHPRRRPVTSQPAIPFREVAFDSDGTTIRGWMFPAQPGSGTTVVALHGIADNRESTVWIARRLNAKGLDVLAYDARAHGESGGDACTYGVREKRDVSRALDALGISRALLVGNSLGAAVALQAAADEPRVIGVVAADTFLDLDSIARDRAPFFASESQIQRAFALAEVEGRFRVAEASAVLAAARVRVPVLLLRSADDRETSARHAEGVWRALGGPKELRVVAGAGHGEGLGKAWSAVESWIEATARR